MRAGRVTAQLNGHQLPADDKRFDNLLKSDPYNVNVNSSERAAKVFFENCRNLNLRDSSGKFKFPNLDNMSNRADKHIQQETIQRTSTPQPLEEPELFTLPIPLGGKRKAYLKYPLEDLSKKDIRVIRKALDFIESSISTEEDDAA